MTHPPTLSIITPCHNGLPYLAEMLASVRAQTFTTWEHIIVDDGSDDGSHAVAEAQAKQDARIRAIRQRQSGVAAARKAGYTVASPHSTYVYFLDADDVIEPDMLQTMVAYLEAHPRAGVAFCDCTGIDEHGRPVDLPRMPRMVPTWFGARELSPDDPLTPLESVYAWAPVMESVSVIRRSAYDATKGWDESVGQPGEGVDLFTEIALRHEIHFVNRPLYRYRRHSSQASYDFERLLAQDLRVQRKWRDRRDLSARDRTRIDAAQRFRMGRLRMHRLAGSATRALARGEVRAAARCALDAAQALMRMMTRRTPWPVEHA